MIGATEIKRVSEIKFLGVVIDEKLSWDAHVNCQVTYKKVSYQLEIDKKNWWLLIPSRSI